MPGMRQDPRRQARLPSGSSGGWDPRRSVGATGEWGQEIPQFGNDLTIFGGISPPTAQEMYASRPPADLTGATGEWDPRQSSGATGEWDPQQVQPAVPKAPAPAPSSFKKEPPQDPIDNPGVQVPSGTGMIRNNRTGATYSLLSNGTGNSPVSAPEVDYARPVEVFGQGKGHYLKNDPMAAMVNGKRVDFGRDTEKERQLTKGNLDIAKAQQALVEGEADIALKNQKLKAKPKAPPNYRWNEEGNLERIPGGAADEKVVTAFHSDTLGTQSATAAMDNLLNVANEVLKSPGLGGNYGLRGVLPNIPGGDAANAKALLQRLKDVAGFSALNELKSAGKNGSSGLGSVTEFEHKILQNQLANLDKAQSAAQVKQEIANLVKATEAAKQRISNHYRSVYGNMLDSSVPGKTESPAPAPATGNSPLPGKTSFDSLPDPAEFNGKIIRDSHTGQRMQSVNGKWTPL